jgi:hypothetical protein
MNVRTAHITASNPVDLAQYLYLKVVLTAVANETISVGYATDYRDTYTQAGTLIPIDTTVTGRTTVNATDSVYLCRFDNTVRGTSISIELSGSPSSHLEIHSIEVVADPLESETLR